MSKEVWKPIPDWEGLYEASSLGRVRSLDRVCEMLSSHGTPMKRLHKGRVLSPGYARRTGYWIVILVEVKRKVTTPIHVAVAAAFHGPRPDGLDVAHENGDKSDNRAKNLSYKTRKENLRDQLRHGTRLHGEKRWNATLTRDDVLEIVERRKGGERAIDLAGEFGVHQSQICHIMSGKSWSRTTGIGGDHLQEV